MQVSRANVWRCTKVLLAAVIVGCVAWYFARILNRPELWEQPLRPRLGGVLLALAAHAAGLCCWGGYWYRLLRALGERITPLAAGFAYFVSQFGKYVPGKALAIVLRVAFARSAGVRTGVAAITALYETLTAMAAGAILAAILLPLLAPNQATLGWQALGLLVVAGVPILPGIFNWLASRAARPFLASDAAPLPRLGIGLLAVGLLQAAIGWIALGGSLLALLWAIRPEEIQPSATLWLTCTAYVAAAYVLGFVALPAPGGLGVREFILQNLLTLEFADKLGASAEGYCAVAVLLLRLLWSVSEVGLAGVFSAAYFGKSLHDFRRHTGLQREGESGTAPGGN